LGELRARARIGFGLLAEVRGNLPEAARHFQTAAREAKRAAVVDVLRVAQRGRMTIAARRGDFSSALVFAWDAYVDACGDSAAEAEMLGNLAQLALDVGRTDAALAGFSAALDRRPGPRIALPVLGGAARAAAALERRELVERFAREIDAYRSDERFAYAIASSLLDLALAFANHDGAAAHDRVTAGLSLAEKYGFHELDFRLREVGERLVTRRRHDTHAEQVQVAPRGETVLRHLIHEATLGEEDRRSSRRRAAVPAH
jgi:tetratricopeptide (TPR) repeat protein